MEINLCLYHLNTSADSALFVIGNTYKKLDYMVIVSICLLSRRVSQTLRQTAI